MSVKAPNSLCKFRHRARSVSPPPPNSQQVRIKRRHSDRGPSVRVTAKASRNRAFHQLFDMVPKDDVLIQVHSCALRKNILLHGHMYLAEHHLCFNSSILGYRNMVVLHYSEITGIEKRKTARMFPTGLTITTAKESYTFASLMTRDQVYDQIVALWETHTEASNHMEESTQESTLNGLEEDDKKSECTYTSLNTEYAKENDSSDHAQAMSCIMRSRKPLAQETVTKQRVTFTDMLYSCQCDMGQHQGLVALDETYSGFTVESMARLLFLENEFLYGFLSKALHCKDVTLGDWKDGKRVAVYTPHARTDSRTFMQWTTTSNIVASKFPSYFSATSMTRAQHTSFVIKTHFCITTDQKHPRSVRVLATSHIIHDHAGLVSSVLEQDTLDRHKLYFNQLHLALKDPRQFRRLHASSRSSGMHVPLSVTRLQDWMACHTPWINHLKSSHLYALLILVLLLTEISTMYHLVRITHHLSVVS